MVTAAHAAACLRVGRRPLYLFVRDPERSQREKQLPGLAAGLAAVPKGQGRARGVIRAVDTLSSPGFRSWSVNVYL